MKHSQKIRLLLTPSWIVSTIGITLGVLATGATIIISRFESSELRRQIFETKDTLDTSAYEGITANIADNSFLNSLPLLITWACVGLVVYYFSVSIARSFSQAIELHDEMNYVHVSRQELIRQALRSLAARVVAVIGWFVFIRLSISFIVPYALAAASIASQELSVTNVGYAVLATVIIAADVWIHAIFMRLIALKPRLFG